MEDKITNLENLPKEVWEELRRSSETMMRNSKIGFFQGVTLLELAQRKLSEFKTDPEKTEDDIIKEVVKDIVDEN